MSAIATMPRARSHSGSATWLRQLLGRRGTSRTIRPAAQTCAASSSCVGAAGVADMRIGQRDQLPRVGRIGQDLLVAGHGGVEHHLADATGRARRRKRPRRRCRLRARGLQVLSRASPWDVRGCLFAERRLQRSANAVLDRSVLARSRRAGMIPARARRCQRKCRRTPRAGRAGDTARARGRRDCAAACSAPRAKMSRLPARWTSSMRSPAAVNCTVCSPTMSPARRLA